MEHIWIGLTTFQNWPNINHAQNIQSLSMCVKWNVHSKHSICMFHTLIRDKNLVSSSATCVYHPYPMGYSNWDHCTLCGRDFVIHTSQDGYKFQLHQLVEWLIPLGIFTPCVRAKGNVFYTGWMDIKWNSLILQMYIHHTNPSQFVCVEID